MIGQQHYAEAEKLLAEGEATLDKIRSAAQEGDIDLADGYGKKAMGIWAQAQVHATLAQAARPVVIIAGHIAYEEAQKLFEMLNPDLASIQEEEK